jgi:hypothetical protein
MKTTATQFVSNDKDKNTFVSVFKHYSNLTEKKVSKEGDLYALLSISGTANLPAERVCKFVWDGTIDGYLYSNAKSTNESLKDSIKEGIRKVKDLIRNDKNIEDSGVNINFIVVAQKEEGLYIGNFGENDIYVYKENRFVNIFEIMQQKKSTTAGIALEENDILILGTNGLITEGMSNFMGFKNYSDVKDALDNFGKQILKSQGMIYFVSQKEHISGKRIEVKADIIKDIPAPRIKLPKKVDGGKKLVEIKDKITLWIKDKATKTKVFFEKNGLLIVEKLETLISKSKIIKKKDEEDSIKGMRIDGYKRKDVVLSRVKKLIIAGVTILVIAVGVVLIVNVKKSRERHLLALESFEKIESLLVKIEENIITDIDSAEMYLFQAGKLFEEIPKELSDVDSKKLEELKSKRLNLEDTAYKRRPVNDADGSISKFLDSRLAFGEGSNPTDIEMYKDKSGNEYIIISDSGLKKIHRVSLFDKSNVYEIPDNEGLIKDPKYMSLGNKGIYVYDGISGVVKAGFKGTAYDKFVQLSGLKKEDIDAQDIVEMIVLAENDNVYLLSKDKSSFLKADFSYENMYSLSYQYIDNDSFANATDIDADISLYFSSTDNPKLIRYVYSHYEKRQIFSDMQAVGFDGDYGNVTKLFTYGPGELKYDLYLFDSQGKRFLRLEKPIESGTDKRHPGQILLVKQIIYRGTDSNMWSDVRDFVVDAKQSAMYVLDGMSVWKVVL